MLDVVFRYRLGALCIVRRIITTHHHSSTTLKHTLKQSYASPPSILITAGSNSPLFEELVAGTEQRWSSLGTPSPPWRYEWLPPRCAQALLLVPMAALLLPGSQHTRADAMLQRVTALLDQELQGGAAGPGGPRAALALRVVVWEAQASMLMTSSRVAHAQACLREAGGVLDAHPALLADLRPGLDMLHGA